MGRPRKGPRLYLRNGRVDGRSGRGLAAIYFIRDGTVQISTGCGPDRLAQAEQALADYIVAKTTPAPSETKRLRDPTQVGVAEVIALYARERAPTLADPVSAKGRLAALLDWWGEKTLEQVSRTHCRAYVLDRTSQPIKAFKDAGKARNVTVATARRELEDLSACIGYWDDEHHLSRRPKVVLPPKHEGSRDALSRSQAAALLRAAMGWRKGPDGAWRRLDRSTVSNRRHLRRFVLIGLYTGTRPGVLPRLEWREGELHPWIDLSRGWIFRKGKRETEHKNKRRPTIRIPRRLLAHLRRWSEADRAMNLARVALGKEPVSTVLHHGGRRISGKIRRGFAAIVRDAGLPANISPHWFRHTAATWLMETEIPMVRVAQYLGMTEDVLRRHYGHLRPDFQTDISDASFDVGR